jgi:peptidoglycan/xylan/chitin deacetylase (PgdA/CDA1 family)
MSISKSIARSAALPILLSFKLDKYFLKKSKRNCCIINFHGVRKSNEGVFNNRHIPEVEFEKIIAYLKNNYSIVSLKDIFSMHKEKKVVKGKTIALTFDDGYINNFEVALPILKKHNVHATFYLISKGLIDQSFFVWPDLVDIIKRYHKEDIAIDNFNFKYPSFYNEELKLSLLNYLKTYGQKTENLVTELSDKLKYYLNVVKESPELIQLVRKEKLIKYANEPLIEYGSHTHSHFNLEYLENDIAEFELKESKRIIEDIIGKRIISLAFPDGSYVNETIGIALKTGYKNIVAVDYRFKENNTNPNLLSRYTISNSTTFESNMLRLAKDFDKYGFN